MKTLIAIVGLPITIPILLYLGFCLLMAHINGEFDQPAKKTP